MRQGIEQRMQEMEMLRIVLRAQLPIEVEAAPTALEAGMFHEAAEAAVGAVQTEELSAADQVGDSTEQAHARPAAAAPQAWAQEAVAGVAAGGADKLAQSTASNQWSTA